MNDDKIKGSENERDPAPVHREVLPINPTIDVWEVTPHLNPYFDVAIFANPNRIIEYFRDLAEEALDSLGSGETMTITITHKSMTRYDYDSCTSD
jgi:hypothetical protein